MSTANSGNANGTRSRQVVALVAALSLSAAAGCGKKEAMILPTPEVYVTTAVQKDVPVPMELVGQTAGSKDVEIRARVEGYLESVNFREGDYVKQGDLLYTIDPKPLEATVAQAKANVATAQAKLVQAAAGRRPAEAPRRAAGGQQARLRQLGLHPGRGEGPARRGEGRARLRPAQPRLHEDHGAPLGPRGPEQGEAGEPRRPWRVDAPHHDLRHRPDLLHGEPERGGLPPPRRAVHEDAGVAGRAAARRPGPRERRRCTRKRATSTRSRGRSTRRPGPSRRGSSSRTRRASSAPGSTAGSSSSSTP